MEIDCQAGSPCLADEMIIFYYIFVNKNLNMKKILTFLTVLLSFCYVVSAQQVNQRITNNNTHEEILIGKCTRKALNERPFQEWFQKEYNLYRNTLDKKSCDSLSNLLKDIKIEIVMGTWCSDSRQHVPDFFAIMDYLGVPDSIITIICVDREKQAVTFSIEDKKIELVPTFIFLKKGAEIGRIIETPQKTLEKDMLSILSAAK